MYIRLRIKTKEKLDTEFMGWNGNHHNYKSDGWYLRKMSGYVGKELTHMTHKMYASFNDVPEYVELTNGYKMPKKYLDWRPAEKKPVYRIDNGLLKL